MSIMHSHRRLLQAKYLENVLAFRLPGTDTLTIIQLQDQSDEKQR